MKKPNAWLALLLFLAAWVLLFSPRLLPGITWKALAWVFISAFLFWPLVFSRWSLRIGVVILALVGVLDIFYIHYFGTLTDEFFLATVFRTNAAEVGDFFRVLPVAPLIRTVGWLGLCALLGWWLSRHARQVLNQWSFLRWSWAPPIAVWLALIAYYGTGDATQRFYIQDKTLSVYPLHLVWAGVKQADISDAALYVPQLPAAAPETARIGTVVVILGESASSERWSLFGYKKNTTNQALESLPGITAMPVMARGLATVWALPFVLTARSVADSIKAQSPSFIDLAKHAGYKVFVFDNSRSAGNGDFFVHVLRRSADSYQKIGNGKIDGVLTEPLRQALNDKAPLKLIVLHTFGSHEIVADRYPPEDARFADPYDNSIAYTSNLLKQWITMLDGSTKLPALLLYTSDHGLSMPPCSTDYAHGRSLSSLEVPFLAWGNPAAYGQMPALFASMSGGEHSNALLAESAIRAVGYGTLLQQPDWPSSLDPTFEGHSWKALQALNACTLR